MTFSLWQALLGVSAAGREILSFAGRFDLPYMRAAREKRRGRHVLCDVSGQACIAAGTFGCQRRWQAGFALRRQV